LTGSGQATAALVIGFVLLGVNILAILGWIIAAAMAGR
jgi:hypothetical protein